MHPNICNVKYKSTSKQRETTACLIGIAAMLLTASRPAAHIRESKTLLGKRKSGSNLMPAAGAAGGSQRPLCKAAPRAGEQQRGPPLIRGLDRANFSMKMPTVVSPLEEIICSRSNGVCRNIKQLPRLWHPLSPSSQGGKVQPRARWTLERIYAETRSSFSCPLVLRCDYGSNAFIRLGKGEKISGEKSQVS